MNRLVIFDMDGVILDSEKLYLEMNLRWFQELGIKLPPEKYETFIGVAAHKMWYFLKTEFNLPEPIEYYIEREKELKHRVLADGNLEPIAGIPQLLDYLRAEDYLMAIASSNLRMNIQLIVDKLNIGSYFDLIVTGEDVPNGKPDPDIFLKAAKDLHFSPAESLVIEDSTNGVTAAKAAGMYCIGYYNPNSGKQDLSKADIIVDSFSDKRIFEVLSNGLTAG